MTFESVLPRVSGLLAPVVLFAGLTVIAAPPAQATVYGGCASYNFNAGNSLGKIDGDGKGDGDIERTGLVPVIHHKVPIYAQPNQGAETGETLEFNQRINIVRREGEFIQVKKNRRDPQALGWVHGDHLLCNHQPIISGETNLAQKFYIRTRKSKRGEKLNTIQAAPSSDMGGPDDCAGSIRCRELSRFSLYFVHAVDLGQQPERLLLVNRYSVDSNATMIGWVTFSNSDPELRDGYLWETRFGVRPREDLVFEADDPSLGVKAGDERFICVYTDKSDANDPTCNLPLLGGDRWFSYPIRVPVLGREGDFFRVVLPVASVEGGSTQDIFGQEQSLSKALSKLQKLRNVDVFFLIDGTQSMDPHIEAIVGTKPGEGILPAVRRAFEADDRFNGVQVRYGFRVYRDLYDGTGGVGEGYPLGSNCDPSERELREDYQAFLAAARQIDTKTGTGNPEAGEDDHAENLYGGIVQAVGDMGSCGDHVKILLVIGDTGYDFSAQADRGGLALTEEQMSSFLSLNYHKTKDPVFPFFIHVPPVYPGRTDYMTPYNDFWKQAELILNPILAHMGRDGEGGQRKANVGTVDDYRVQMKGVGRAEDQQKLVTRILETVAGFSDQRPINELIAELQGGAALVEIIEDLQDRPEFGNLPGLRLAQIERRLCEELGDACEQRVVNDISEGFIKDNSDVVTDVWLRNAEFTKWLRMLEQYTYSNTLTLDELSDLLKNTLLQSVEAQIGNDTLDDLLSRPGTARMTVAEFLEQKLGLPVNELSPLLKYSLGDIVTLADSKDGVENLIHDCEFYHLAGWLDRHREIFQIVQDGQVPKYQLREASAVECEFRHPTPEMVVTGRERFAKSSLSFSHTVSGDDAGANIFWLPSEYLP